MNLKLVSRFVLIFSVLALLFSCNPKDSDELPQSLSKDSQIYSFNLKAKPWTSSRDTVAYKVLEKTKFLIRQRQSKSEIYNPDSLPFGTRLKKFEMKLNFSKYGVSSIKVIYKEHKNNVDSIFTWNEKDSIDFSRNNVEIEVTAPSGSITSKYTVNLRVHAIDPDTIPWVRNLPLININNNTTSFKPVLKGNKFYCYSVNDGNLLLHTLDKSIPSVAWTAVPLISPPTSIDVESITVYNDKFYAINTLGYTFSSTDGASWTNLGDKKAHSIVGILPGEILANDSLLTIIKDTAPGKFIFATTADMSIFNQLKVHGTADDVVSSDFPSINFSSATNYDRTNSKKNMLAVSGGYTFDDIPKNVTWLLKRNDGGLELIKGKPTSAFTHGMHATFLYNSRYYALVSSSLYTTTNWGIKWSAAPAKQAVSQDLVNMTSYRAIVDEDNFIWIFGKGMDIIKVNKGRLNSLIP